MGSPITKKDLDNLEKRVDKKLEAFEKRIEVKINKAFEDIMDIFKIYMQHVDERFDAVDQRFEEVDKRFAEIDERFEEIDKRFDEIDVRFDRVDVRFNEVDKQLSTFSAYTKNNEADRAVIDAKIKRLETLISTQ